MNYRVLITDEATDDVFNLVKYIQVDLCNPDAANKLYTNLNREVNNMGDFPLKFADSGIKYRGYIIHKKIYQSYLLFYIISDENQTVYVLRILKDIMNWRNILQKKNIYHFSILYSLVFLLFVTDIVIPKKASDHAYIITYPFLLYNQFFALSAP